MPKVKTGGRARGTPNKRTQALKEILEGKGISIPERIMAALPDLPIERQITVLLDLMPYLYPKRKSVELQVDSDPEPIGDRVDLSKLSIPQIRQLMDLMELGKVNMQPVSSERAVIQLPTQEQE